MAKEVWNFLPFEFRVFMADLLTSTQNIGHPHRQTEMNNLKHLQIIVSSSSSPS